MHEELIRFSNSVGKLKTVDRKGWVSWAKVKHPESVADHTMRSAVLAMCLSDLRGLDTDRLVRMALLHDIHEALIGDYDYFDKKRMGETEVKKREEVAIKDVFSILPETLRQKYTMIADEYRLQQTNESKLVREIDQLEMIMQALEYEKEGNDKTKLQTFWDEMQNKLHDPDVKRIFELLEKERKRGKVRSLRVNNRF